MKRLRFLQKDPDEVENSKNLGLSSGPGRIQTENTTQVRNCFNGNCTAPVPETREKSSVFRCVKKCNTSRERERERKIEIEGERKRERGEREREREREKKREKERERVEREKEREKKREREGGERERERERQRE